MSEIRDLTDKILKFRADRDWQKFHNPKDMALSLVLEATELLEHFQWKNGEELKTYLEAQKTEVSEELSDILYWVLLMAHDLKIDIASAFKAKLLKNCEKYPVDTSKGSSAKYDTI